MPKYIQAYIHPSVQAFLQRPAHIHISYYTKQHVRHSWVNRLLIACSTVTYCYCLQPWQKFRKLRRLISKSPQSLQIRHRRRSVKTVVQYGSFKGGCAVLCPSLAIISTWSIYLYYWIGFLFSKESLKFGLIVYRTLNCSRPRYQFKFLSIISINKCHRGTYVWSYITLKLFLKNKFSQFVDIDFGNFCLFVPLSGFCNNIHSQLIQISLDFR